MAILVQRFSHFARFVFRLFNRVHRALLYQGPFSQNRFDFSRFLFHFGLVRSVFRFEISRSSLRPRSQVLYSLSAGDRRIVRD